jgi:hypothetical protein
MINQQDSALHKIASKYHNLKNREDVAKWIHTSSLKMPLQNNR